MRFLLTMLMTFPLCAQAPEAPPPAPPPGVTKTVPARAAFKNLQLLKPTEVMTDMRGFRIGLGVDCAFCHVRGDFSSDVNHHKLVAREMIELVRTINAKFPDGKQHVTCYTCHRGAEEPLMTPPVNEKAPEQQPPQARPAEPPHQ